MSFLSLRNVAILLLVVGLVASTGGCEDRANSTKPVIHNPISFATLDFEKRWAWHHYAQAHYVIRNEDQWQRMWRRSHYATQVGVPPTPPSPPPVDFKSEMILAVFQGHHGSGGYGVVISDVGESDEQLTVMVKYREPRPDEPTIAMETNPFYMVSAPRSDKPVGFRIVEVSGPL